MTEKEMIAKAKNAGSAEEIKALAAKEGWQMSDEEAAQNFDALQKYLSNQHIGELGDDELDSVSGGGCGSWPMVYRNTTCNEWVCKKGGSRAIDVISASGINGKCKKCDAQTNCPNCKYCSKTQGRYLCKRK